MLSPIIRLGHQTGLIMSAPGSPSFVLVPLLVHTTTARLTHPVPSTIITSRGYDHARAPTLDRSHRRTVHLKFKTGPILIIRMPGIWPASPRWIRFPNNICLVRCLQVHSGLSAMTSLDCPTMIRLISDSRSERNLISPATVIIHKHIIICIHKY